MYKYFYLLSLTLVFIIPTLIAGFFVIEHIELLHLFVFVLLITIVGSLWDVWATRHGSDDPIWLWHFNHKQTIGIKFLGLPIEEYLFYVFSSVYIIFIWKSIELALSTGNNAYYLLIPALGLWTFLSILIPYKMTKGDKLHE